MMETQEAFRQRIQREIMEDLERTKGTDTLVVIKFEDKSQYELSAYQGEVVESILEPTGNEGKTQAYDYSVNGSVRGVEDIYFPDFFRHLGRHKAWSHRV